MAYNGVNGWYYNGIACYYGKNLALSSCSDCRHLREKSGNITDFGDYSYVCSATTDSAASQMGMGKMVSSCSCYEKDQSEKYAGKTGIGTGFGQMMNSMDKDGKVDVDQMVAGAGKVALGAAVAIGKGAMALARNAHRLMVEEAAKRLEETYKDLGEINFDGEKNSINAIEKLFMIFRSVSSSISGFAKEDREAVADLALLKIDEGIGVLQREKKPNFGKIDKFIDDYQRAKVERLSIKTAKEAVKDGLVGTFVDGFTGKGESYKIMWATLDSYSFLGSEKLIFKNISALFSTYNTIFNSHESHEDKKELWDAVTERINDGMEELVSRGYPKKKLEKEEKELEKYAAKREKLEGNLSEHMKLGDLKADLKSSFKIGGLFGKK